MHWPYAIEIITKMKDSEGGRGKEKKLGSIVDFVRQSFDFHTHAVDYPLRSMIYLWDGCLKQWKELSWRTHPQASGQMV